MPFTPQVSNPQVKWAWDKKGSTFIGRVAGFTEVGRLRDSLYIGNIHVLLERFMTIMVYVRLII